MIIVFLISPEPWNCSTLHLWSFYSSNFWSGKCFCSVCRWL